MGETRTDMIELLKFMSPGLPELMPVHLLGIGDPWSIRNAIPLGKEQTFMRSYFSWNCCSGIDTFDSSYPTKLARHGSVFETDEKTILLRKREFRDSTLPLSQNCDCYTCEHYSRGYLHHLLKAREPLCSTLLSIHNLRMMMKFMENYRQLIRNNAI